MARILIVDDSIDTINLLKFMLKSLEPEFQVDYALTSREAIDFFNNHSYNACILDVSLPDITGYLLGQLIRDSCPEMPIAFLTNYDGTATKENAEAIKAEFWEKAKLLTNAKTLREKVQNLAYDGDCGARIDIELPKF